MQGNTTLAQSDVNAARELLVELQLELSEFQAAYVGEIIAALDDTLKFLPGAPLTAADSLERAWQMLAAGLPDEPEIDTSAASDETPTPEPTDRDHSNANTIGLFNLIGGSQTIIWLPPIRLFEEILF